ncbi:diguanylate cyclase [Neiella marina]|uniref:Diguanylate cyclase n=1 Tax=Neiella holothuriorum TaxID=2870530 RepID=A0ABS7EHB7_9GAMM|nr:diguanylate cyclase [Neiella holothuriorum]MBW8191734.1 diguanylate cyclase [Neiella holothuriorum]
MSSFRKHTTEAMLPRCNELTPKLWPIAMGIFGTLILLLAGFTLHQRTQIIEQHRLDTSQSAIVAQQLLSRILQDKINHIEQTTRLLATNQSLTAYASDGTQEARKDVEAKWKKQAELWQTFVQIRYIDVSGQEQIRVNFSPSTEQASATDQLQFKGHRPYIRHAATLTNNEVGLTLFDLEREHNEFVKPYLIAARMVTPVLNEQGNRTGYLVVNLNIADFLSNFRLHQSITKLNLDILSTQGHYIYEESPDISYGHVIAERAHLSVAQFAPDLWQSMEADNHNGIYIGDNTNGAYSVLTIQPDNNTKFASDHQFILLTQFSNDDVIASLKGPLTAITKHSLAILLVMIVLSLLLAVALRKVLSKQNAKRLMLHSTNGMAAAVMTDQNRTIIATNRKFSQLMGYRAKESLGKTPQLFRSGFHSSEYIREIWQQLNTTGQWQGEIVYRTKSGELITTWQEVSAIYWSKRSKSPDYYIASFIDISKQKKLEQQLRKQSITDPLTGAFNRRRFDDELSRLINDSTRYPSSHFSLVLLDIDHFKRVNDEQGHDVGDEVLIEFVQLVAGMLRNTDFLGRIGGEEFAVLLPFTDAADAYLVMERIRQRVASSIKSSPVTCSIGVVQYEQQVTVKAMYRAADTALYRAKATGRNRTEIYQHHPEAAGLTNRAG